MIKFLHLNSEKPYAYFQALYQKAIENAAQNKNVVLRNMPMDIQRKIFSRYKDTKSILNKSENYIKNIIKKGKFD